MNDGNMRNVYSLIERMGNIYLVQYINSINSTGRIKLYICKENDSERFVERMVYFMRCNNMKTLILTTSLYNLMEFCNELTIELGAYDHEYYLTLEDSEEAESTIETKESTQEETHEPPLTDEELKRLRFIIKDYSRALDYVNKQKME